MINVQTRLNVIDNTGVKKILCIRILNSSKSTGKIGDIIIGSIKDVIPQSKLKKSEIVRGVIVRSRQLSKRLNGTRITFSDNAVVLITKEKNPIGTRLFGPIAKELRVHGFTKIATLALELV